MKTISKSQIFAIMKSWRVLVLILFIIFAVMAIQPRPFAKGAYISEVGVNSSAEINGVIPGELVLSVDEEEVKNTEDFVSILASKSDGDILDLKTETDRYSVVVSKIGGENYIGVSVKESPTSNIKKGLDLVGGTRVVLKPAEEVSEQQLSDAVDIIRQRLNVFGVSDIVIRPTKDLQGNEYIIVELAGVSREEASQLISQQGKFEAKIGEEGVFVGGSDIVYVCRSAECSGIDIQNGCGEAEGGWACSFQFLVDISPEAARRHADVTKDIPVTTVNGNRYLEKKIDLYLDNVLVDSLYISESLRGSDTTAITIQGPGYGSTKEGAVQNALDNMKNMQTVLITGSLPVKFDVVKMDLVSPTLGEKFLNSALLALFAALIAVGAIVFIRYRRLKISIPIIITGISEVIIILGFAALIRWNLDLAAIAGILAAVGTGVDDQIVITDEAISGEKVSRNWKERMKNAFFIIFAAYFTTLVAMLPLWWMGAGLIKGFALTTIAGVTIGVLVTRPAYAKIIEILLKEN